MFPTAIRDPLEEVLSQTLDGVTLIDIKRNVLNGT